MQIRRIACSVALLAVGAAARAQSIFTIAGGGTDDGRPATVAALASPHGIAVDASGNVYIAEGDGERVRKVTIKSGIMTTVAGIGSPGVLGDGGPATSAGLFGPTAVAVDRFGDLYIADSQNARIRKVEAATGIITKIAGKLGPTSGFSGDGGPATEAELDDPEGVAVDAVGNVYIADTHNNRIRRVSINGIISTVVGNGSGGFAGDGGPATAAALNQPMGIALDALGNLYITDTENHRIRKVSPSGIISTVAGNGDPGPDHIGTFSGDGGPATAAGLAIPQFVAIDAAGNLYIGDFFNFRVRVVEAGSGIIRTVAGDGTFGFSGDGGPATAAHFEWPTGVAVDAAGNLYIADSNNLRVRRVAADTNIITTIAGNGIDTFLGDDGPATAAALNIPEKVAVDRSGNLYIADAGNGRIRKRDAATGFITTLAGRERDSGSHGDGGPATSADVDVWGVALDALGNIYIAGLTGKIRRVDTQTGIISTIPVEGTDVAVDPSGDLYLADRDNHVIRKFSVSSGLLTTIGGKGTAGFSGDGGPATAAEISGPDGIAVDTAGNVYIADSGNNRIRKIAAASGIISTVAGNGEASFLGDGGPATAAGLFYPAGVAIDASGDLYIADTFFSRVRKVSAVTGIISTLAGHGATGLTGDGAVATTSNLNNPGGVAVDLAGNVYIADSFNKRIRAILACVTVGTPKLSQPADGASGEKASPKLAWSAVKGAFRYDVYLDVVNPPAKIAASDVTAPSYSPANLEPLTTYYWRVVAKGDSFCSPASTSSSSVSSFTTTGACSAPAAFDPSEPVQTGGMVQLSWSPSPRAQTYDVAIGTTSPPRLYATNVTEATLTVSGLASGTTYFWSATAHASCDPARTTSAPVQSFTTGGACAPLAGVTLAVPADREATSPAVTFSWSAAAGASGYDFYLGSGSSPQLYMTDLAQTSVTVSKLSAGAEYSWKVVARAACDATKSVASPVRRFTVGACGAPGTPSIVSTSQASLAAGATYTIAWSEAAGMDAGASYLVERATDAQFALLVDRQETTATSASFLPAGVGTYYHRVTSIAGCDRSRRSHPSDSASVVVAAGPPVVTFTMQPRAVITALGEKLEDQRTLLAIENLGSATVQVLIAPQLLGGSVPFFSVVDPLGGEASFVTLEPHKPRTLELRFSGPPSDQAGSYQGGIDVASLGQPLAFTPQVYVNLKVGGDVAAAAPKLLVNGIETDLAFFSPVTGDDSVRPSLMVDLSNSGTSPMEVAGEIGPEAWLKMEKDWNATAVPARSFRPLRLSTQRTRALAGSALPRYTYLTVRNKAGQSARLLVEDVGGLSAGRGRGAPPEAGERSLILPELRSGKWTSSLYLTNTGPVAVPLELVWTPDGADGFDDNRVKRASLVVPPNDVVCLIDPLPQIFATTGDALGSLEIRSSPEKLGSLVVRSEIRTSASADVGSYGYAVPAAMRSEGARIGAPHQIAGVTSDAALGSALRLTETSGRDVANVHVTLYDKNGARRGEQTIALPRYGSKSIDDIGASLAGGTDVEGGRIEIDVTAGGGAVLGLVTVSDRTGGGGATFAGRPLGAEVRLSSLGHPIAPSAASSVNAKGRLLIAGVTREGTSLMTLGVTAATNASVTITYRDGATGSSSTQNVALAAGETREYSDFVQVITGSIAPSHGTVTIESDGEIAAYARVTTGRSVDALPVVSPYGEVLTGGGAAKPVYAEGLEQSLDRSKGRSAALLLTEVGGLAAVVNVRLYEPGNRSAAIADKDFSVPPYGELRLDNLFASMDLESGPDDPAQRRKERVNVVCVVTPKGGGGVVQSLLIVTDNRSHDRRTIQLLPAGGVPATTPQRLFAPQPARRRAVR